MPRKQRQENQEVVTLPQINLNVPGTLCGRLYKEFLKGGEVALKRAFGKVLQLKTKPLEYRQAVVAMLVILSQEGMLLERTDAPQANDNPRGCAQTLNERLTHAWQHEGERGLKKDLGMIFRSKKHPQQYRDALVVVMDILKQHNLQPHLMEELADKEPTKKATRKWTRMSDCGAPPLQVRTTPYPLNKSEEPGPSAGVRHMGRFRNATDWETPRKPGQRRTHLGEGPDAPSSPA